jgi:hypothetical protein
MLDAKSVTGGKNEIGKEKTEEAEDSRMARTWGAAVLRPHKRRVRDDT